jgi:hypothetical protein
MNTGNDYQWRYRRPAPSFHETFAATVSLETHARRQRRRRLWMLIAFVIGLGGSAIPSIGGSVAAPENNPLARADCLVQQTVSAVTKLPILVSTDG